MDRNNRQDRPSASRMRSSVRGGPGREGEDILYLTDKSGRRTHAQVPIEQFERLMAMAEPPADPFSGLPEVALEAVDLERIDRLRGEPKVPFSVANRMARGEIPLRVWRQYRRLTVAVLADQAKVSPAAVHKIEQGVTVGRVRVLAALARALDVTIDDLVAEEAPTGVDG